MARTSLSALFHTLRWIPPGQLAALLRERARRAFEDPARIAGHMPPPEPAWRAEPERAPVAAPCADPAALVAGRFRFLNREAALGWPPRWSDGELPRLWLYNLHYFEFLAALDYESGRDLVLDWIARHPPARAAVGWEPYPVSLRLQEWCAWLGVHGERVRADAELRARLWPSLWRQAQWLAAHPEVHLRANHLLENAAALAACGARFRGAGDAWLARGLELLDRELPEQILADGVHFERTPLYHARAVRVLDQLEASGVPELAARVAEPLARMRRALARLTHPDGEIALLNDAAFGIAPAPGELLGDSEPEAGSFALEAAGYYGARAGPHYLVCDAAAVGPDYQPGHAHADLLSFELSLDGQRVIVDAGVHGYDDDPLREWCRSTRAHNTVEVEGADQCELWGTFRVGRRGRPRDVRWSPSDAGFELAAAHDGYQRLPGRPRHERRFLWNNAGSLAVEDRVSAGREVCSASRLHLHPACAVEARSDRAVRVRHPGGAFRVRFEGEGRLALEDSTWCPEFGRREATRCLSFAFAGRDCRVGFRIERETV